VWTRLGSRGCQLGIRRAEGPTVNFLGFKDKVGGRGLGGLGGGSVGVGVQMCWQEKQRVWVHECAGGGGWQEQGGAAVLDRLSMSEFLSQ
jgi:hypothetical protein